MSVCVHTMCVFVLVCVGVGLFFVCVGVLNVFVCVGGDFSKTAREARLPLKFKK